MIHEERFEQYCLRNRLNAPEREELKNLLTEATKDMWTDEDIKIAHKEGWKSAYYAGAKQHQSSEEWLIEYKQSKQAKQS